MKPKHPTPGILVTAIFLLTVLVNAQAPLATAFDTFENGVPAHWQADDPADLSTTTAHSKHGSHSLAWTPRGARGVTVHANLADIGRTGGYGGTYSKATFGIWIYSEKVQTGSIRIECRTGDRVGGFFEYPLDFTGWRRAHLKYRTSSPAYPSEFVGAVAPTTDNLRLSGHGTADDAKVFFDLVVYNGLLDYRQQYTPAAKPESPVVIDAGKFPLPRDVPPATVAAIASLGKRIDGLLLGTNGMSPADLHTVLNESDRMDASPYPPLVHVQWAEFYAGIPGVETADKFTSLMLRMARAWHASADPSVKSRLAKSYVAMARHLKDQGMFAGSGYTWNWYPGVNLADGNFLMRGPLAEGGLLGWASRYLEYNYGTADIFDDRTVDPNMDYFHNDLRPKICGALMQPTDGERLRALSAVKRRLDLDILARTANGFKPEGSAFHHGMHYFAYMTYSFNTLARLLECLAGSPWQVSAEAQARVRAVAMNMRFYAHERDIPLSLSGRHPFTQSVNPETFLALSKAFAMGERLDPELAGAYLRYMPDQAGQGAFLAQGLKPEPIPQGNLSMNYAALMAHRRRDWLVTVKGTSAWALFGEIYAKNNRFGRYIGSGHLEVLSGGNPVSREGSGKGPAGWDWNLMEGTTAIRLPLDQLVAVSSGTEMTTTPHGFVGGLTWRGQQGVFAFPFQGDRKHNGSFKGIKTYFFFDDRIVCLGSGIGDDDGDHETITTLFQKKLPRPGDAQWVDGKEVVSFPHEASLTPGTLVDPQGTGYVLAPGQTVCLTRMKQVGRDHANTSNTEGDFASAWISHGKAPSDATYEYLMIPKVAPARLLSIALASKDPNVAAYRVVQRNDAAHIVWDRATGLTGACIFTPGNLLTLAPVVATDRPCLVLFKGDGKNLLLSVGDPDLALSNHGSPMRTIRLTLAGKWTLLEPVPGCRASPDGTDTALLIETRDGMGHDLVLTGR